MPVRRSSPFKKGQLAEAKTFDGGFRGAWFRCKIHDIKKRKGQNMLSLEYYDYPDEKIDWVDLYQNPPYSSGNSKRVKRELMVRPKFPLICHENELPDMNAISEVIVVIDGVWRVGDLVDWFSDGCFWSGTVTEIEGDDKIKIKLPEEPIGEGSSYDVSHKDLRPSLDWSPKDGWTVPRSQEGENGRACARLIQPLKQGSLRKSLINVVGNDKQNVEATPRSSLEFDESISSHTSTSSLPQQDSLMQSTDLEKQNEDIAEKEMQQTEGPNKDLAGVGSANEKPSCSDGVSSSFVRDVSAEEQHNDHGCSKKMRMNETVPLNSAASDSLESTIMDFEELLNRVKWLRQIVKLQISSNTPGPAWKFVEHPAVSKPK